MIPALPAPGESAAPLTDAYAIFSNARRRIEAARYPAQVSYNVIISVRKNGKTSVARYHSYYDSTNGAVRVVGVTEDELAHPYTPHGMNTFLNLFGSSIPLSPAQRTFDYLGVPVLAPNYFFGLARYAPKALPVDEDALVQEIRREFHEPPKAIVPSASPAARMKTIANVEAVYRDYVIHLAGTESVNGHRDYHLSLAPVRSPYIYRLRDLWIDAGTFSVDRLTTQGNFMFGGPTEVAWTTTFQEIGGAPYIASESTDEPFSDFRHNYDAATVTFSQILPAKMPPYASIFRFAINRETGVPPLVEPPAGEPHS